MMNRPGYSIACAKLDAALSTNVQAWASNYWISQCYFPALFLLQIANFTLVRCF